MTDLDILAGAAILLAGLFLIMQASMLGSGNLGWITRPWYSRLAMTAVGLLFWVRAWTVFHGQPVNPIGRWVCLALLVWQFVDLLHVITASWETQAQLTMLAAGVERKKSRLVLAAAVEMLGPTPPYTIFRRARPRERPRDAVADR